MIYVCKKCLFAFERIAQVDSCPDCGSLTIYEANAHEKADYLRNRECSESVTVKDGQKVT